MKERPILFSAPMVRALLAGTKTQTRRILKPTPLGIWNCPTPIRPPFVGIINGPKGAAEHPHDYCWNSPYGDAGDRLWVREAFMLVGGGDPGIPIYRANWREDAQQRGLENVPATEPKGWTPSIHMPRKLSRILLNVTDVRVERLRDISEADAIAEGIIRLPATGRYVHTQGAQYAGLATTTARDAYSLLWESINGPGSWDENPWVWCVTFERVNGRS